MRKILILSLIFLFGANTFCKADISENQKLSALCRIWGFLKYCHPKVAKGQYDWDKVLIDKIPEVRAVRSKEELDNLFNKWIMNLGKVRRNHNAPDSSRNSIMQNIDLRWIDDHKLFDDSLIQQLSFIRDNCYRGKRYYVQKNLFVDNCTFKHEKSYEGMAYPSAEYRLLTLFRYWNIINYWYPDKYLIGRDWGEVLNDMIPKFLHSEDTIAYHLAIRELIGSVNDSHATFASKYTRQYFGKYWAPFSFIIIDHKAVVYSQLKDAYLQRGDVISEVDGKAIADVIKERWKYVEGSNDDVKRRFLYDAIFNGNTDTVSITYEHNDTIYHKTIRRYLAEDFKKTYKPESIQRVRLYDSGHIAYVYMNNLGPEQADSMMRRIKRADAIIFDDRCYPDNCMYKISEYLDRRLTPFARFSEPCKSYPAKFRYTSCYHCGKLFGNRHYYKGKVIILVNAYTQSHAEFTAMSLQTAENAVVIGSQTAGADGNVYIITLPGGYKTAISGLGVYYPDKRPTQRIGIVPDIYVKPTVAGIKTKKDEVLDRALDYVRTGK